MATLGALSVVLVTHYFPAHRGGVERVAGQLAERLAAAGVARIDWHASDCDPVPASVPGLRAVPAPSWNIAERRLGFPYPVWTPRALRRLARACREADIVHLHDCLYLPNLVAFAAARAARRPVVVTQHVGEVPYRNPLLGLLQRAANRVLGAWMLGGADRVVFESETVRDYFRTFVRFRAQPLLVQNGVDTEFFSPVGPDEKRRLRQQLGVPVEGPLLLFIGRFVEKKGLAVLEQLTERVQRAHWLFAGWGPLDPLAWHRPNVTVVHKPDSGALPSLYRAADLLVLPSAGEGFPLSIQEAMACGTPALVGADTAAGCPEAGNLLLRETVGAMDTATRWAARIEELIGPLSELGHMRAPVASFARQQWSWEQCVDRYSALFRTCAS
ncbi:MAG TPA: glycosyltransferase family 4 protein [Burkholderiales bacterium]|nr:glycosyltransferase family 4 protein [Burkholderiales bacterium]